MIRVPDVPHAPAVEPGRSSWTPSKIFVCSILGISALGVLISLVVAVLSRQSADNEAFRKWAREFAAETRTMGGLMELGPSMIEFRKSDTRMREVYARMPPVPSRFVGVSTQANTAMSRTYEVHKMMNVIVELLSLGGKRSDADRGWKAIRPIGAELKRIAASIEAAVG